MRPACFVGSGALIVATMNKDLKITLESLVARYNTTAFMDNDPVLFPRCFLGKTKQDIEIAAFLASTIDWGNRKQIMNGCRKMLFDIMDGKPYDFVMQHKWEQIDPECSIHRTFFGRDLAYMCKGLHSIFIESYSFEYVFIQSGCNVWKGFETLREMFAKANGGKYSKHLSNPTPNRHKGGSACKRLNLMLRWLCRQDGIVDLGIWHELTPDKLMMPLDVHVARVGRELGLITRQGNDRKTVEELTRNLAAFDPQDPCKYDFALFGIGESQKHVKR